MIRNLWTEVKGGGHPRRRKKAHRSRIADRFVVAVHGVYMCCGLGLLVCGSFLSLGFEKRLL